MSKYRNSRRDSKNFEFFPKRVFQTFDSKHGSPEEYSDFFFVKLNNYVVQLIGVASVLSRHGSFTIFFTPKQYEPRRPFFYTSKHGTRRIFRKNFKVFATQVFQIFDSKHGSPENYSDFFFKLNNYVVQLIKLKNYVFELNGFTSVSHDFGSRKIFLLLNDSSHGPHFSACQNIETLDRIQKISNFSLKRFSRYLTPNMALQTIILTSFFFFFFLFFPFFSSSRLRAMRSPGHNSSKILSN